jgi:hypothetical protein
MTVAGTHAQAQFRQSIFLNGALPTGQFAKDVNTDRGILGDQVPLLREEIGKDATPGFGLGYRISYRFDVGMGEVAPFAQADFFWNVIGSKWSDKYIQAKGKSPNYFNIPIMLGVSYLYDELWNDITPYAEFAVGGDLFIIGSEKVTIADKSYTYAYKPTVALSWMFGLGAYFGRHVSAGIYYYGLGKHNIDYTKGTLENNMYADLHNQTLTSRQKRTVGSIMLRIGFHF